MKNLKLSIVSMLLVLVLLTSLIVPSFAASGTTTLVYSTEYNSGERGDVCTTLDGTSASSYYANYDYDDLSLLSSSALFTTLQTLMRNTHDNISSYDDCHYEANRTDCQNGDGSVSLIYTAYSATMSQWGSWNREHVWPQSLGGGNTNGGGADMHHIRPSDNGVNSSRGNKPYGNAGAGANEKYGSAAASGVLGGYYNSTYFEPLDSVKGDVARICLYVYVRWNSQWGASNITQVFESVDVLLDWCEQDPVDTWEMGRNEVVGDIQGNRNVFIDYPEYAWLIFDREVPTDMVTPSGEAADTTTGGGSTGGGSTETPDEPEVGASATLDFSIAGNRTSYSTEEQVWEQNGITLTNVKGSSTTNVGDYTNPLRLYKNSSVTVAGQKKIAKIEFTCNNASYAEALNKSIAGSAIDGSVVTVTLATPATSFDFVASEAQIRINNLTVYYVDDGSSGCAHTNTSSTTDTATCTENGSTTIVCVDCGDTLSVVVIEAKGHSYTYGVCTVCQAVDSEYVPSTPSTPSGSALATFEFGENGDASHKDGSGISDGQEYTDGGYTLTLSGISKVYGGAFDAKGNSCLKLGTSSVVGTFTFTVPSNVNSVVIKVAGYKANAGAVNINGTETAITTKSDNGEYMEITVDTSTSKTVTVSTVSGKQRAMINSISFMGGSTTACTHANTTTSTKNATCTEDGSITTTCTACGKVISTTAITATGHNYVSGTCTKCGAVDSTTGLVPTVVGTPAVGTAYKLGMLQGNIGTVYYLKGGMDGYYMASTSNYDEALDVYLENTTGGYYLYCYVDGAKTYINMVVSGTHVNGAYEASASTVYTFDTEDKIIVATVNDAEYAFGTRNDKTYSTIGPVAVSYNGFHSSFYNMAPGSTEPDEPETPKPTTPEEIVNAAYALGNGETLAQGPYTLTGIITSIGEAWSDQYKNITVTIVVGGMTDKPIVCFRLKGTGAETLKVGDTITVEGNLINYSGTIEFNSGCTVTAIVPGEGTEPDEPDEPVVPDEPITGDYADLDFSDLANRTEQTTEEQVWEQNGITLTNKKGASTSNIIDSSNPVRLYKNSTVIISGNKNIAGIRFTCNNETYATALVSAIGSEATSNGNVVTVILDSPATSYEIILSGGQVRLNSLTVYYEEAEEEELKIDYASVTIGTNLQMNYYVSGFDSAKDYYMVFTMNGIASERIAGRVEGKYLVFTYSNIAPQCMGDNISASLYMGDDETVLLTMESYSVKAYAEQLIATKGDDEKLMDIVADMLRYGAAAQIYRKYKVTELVTDNLNTGSLDFDLMGSTATPTEDDNDRTISPELETMPETDTFVSAGVRFDYDNKVFVKLKTDDIAKISLTVDGVAVDMANVISLGGGNYVYYTDGVDATEFDKIFTVKMYVNGTLTQTLTYSVNSYAYAMCGDLTVGDEAELAPIARLVRALYRYGLSAKNYVG